jgi:hypothetical protein
MAEDGLRGMKTRSVAGRRAAALVKAAEMRRDSADTSRRVSSARNPSARRMISQRSPVGASVNFSIPRVMILSSFEPVSRR